MKTSLKWKLIAAAIVAVISLTAVGVFANTQIQLNGGSDVSLGAGSAPVNSCDSSVDINPIIYNDGNNVFIQGFRYDNVDKAACVGFDFETHFVSNSNTAIPLFATSSIGSDPSLLRVFAPTASSSWQLGLGAQPSVEATVTELSSSSFKVLFTNPISLASDLGEIVMAELTHLPLGVFTNGYSQLGTVNGNWENSCLVSNNSKFYALDVTNGLYQSSTIPSFPASVGSVGISQLSSSAIAGANWYGLGCSANGQYLAVSGTSGVIAYSSDYGATWQNKSSSSYLGTGTVGAISISNDGKIVAISVGSTPGYFNFWVNGNFWTSTSSSADASYQVVGARAATVKVCGNGTTIYGGGGTNSAGLYRWSTSSISSGGSKGSVAPASTKNAFGTYILQIDCSADGVSAVLASYSNSNVYVTRDQFANYTIPNGLSTTSGGVTTRPQTVSMSASGQFVAVGTGDSSGAISTAGTTQYSTDFGQNLSNTSYINHYMQTITLASDGSRLVTGGAVTASKFVLLASG